MTRLIHGSLTGILPVLLFLFPVAGALAGCGSGNGSDRAVEERGEAGSAGGDPRVAPDDRSAADRSGTAARLAVGDEFGGWVIVEIEKHTEYRRYFFERAGEGTAVEVTFRREGTGGLVTDNYLIQPAPGERPPQALLRAVWQRFLRIDAARAPVVSRIPAAGPGADEKLITLAELHYGTTWRFCAGLLALALIAGWLVTQYLDAFREGFRPGGGALARGALFTVIAAFSYFFLLGLSGRPPVTLDLSRDLLLARSCYQDLYCLSGPRTSFRGLFQGTLWARFLLPAHLPGFGIAGSWITLLFLQALAVGLFHRSSAQALRPGAAVWSAALYLLGITLLIPAGEFSNHSLLPLPLAAFFAAASAVLRTGRVREVALSAFLLAICLESHAACIGLVPAFAFLVLVSAHKPLWASGAGLLAFSSIAFWLSPESLINNAVALWRDHGRSGLVAFSLALLFATALRRRWRSLAVPARLIGFCALWLMGFIVLSAAVTLTEQRPFLWVYSLQALPPAAFLAAAGLGAAAGWLQSRRGRAATSGIAVPLLAASIASGFWVKACIRAERSQAEWLVSDMERLAEHFRSRDLGYRDLAPRLRTLENRLFLAGIAPYLSATRGTGKASGGEELLVLRRPAGELPASLPEGWQRVPLGSGTAALLWSHRAWVRQQTMEVCHRPLAADGSTARCTRTGWADGEPDADHAARWISRAYPTLPVRAPKMPPGAYEVTYTFPVRITGEEARRRIRTARIRTGQGLCGWWIGAVRGVRYRGALPALSVELMNSEARTGALEVTARFNAEGCLPKHAPFPPPLVETRDDTRRDNQ